MARCHGSQRRRVAQAPRVGGQTAPAGGADAETTLGIGVQQLPLSDIPRHVGGVQGTDDATATPASGHTAHQPVSQLIYASVSSNDTQTVWEFADLLAAGASTEELNVFCGQLTWAERAPVLQFMSRYSEALQAQAAASIAQHDLQGDQQLPFSDTFPRQVGDTEDTEEVSLEPSLLEPDCLDSVGPPESVASAQQHVSPCSVYDVVSINDIQAVWDLASLTATNNASSEELKAFVTQLTPTELSVVNETAIRYARHVGQQSADQSLSRLELQRVHSQLDRICTAVVPALHAAPTAAIDLPDPQVGSPGGPVETTSPLHSVGASCTSSFNSVGATCRSPPPSSGLTSFTATSIMQPDHPVHHHADSVQPQDSDLVGIRATTASVGADSGAPFQTAVLDVEENPIPSHVDTAALPALVASPADSPEARCCAASLIRLTGFDDLGPAEFDEAVWTVFRSFRGAVSAELFTAHLTAAGIPVPAWLNDDLGVSCTKDTVPPYIGGNSSAALKRPTRPASPHIFSGIILSS